MLKRPVLLSVVKLLAQEAVHVLQLVIHDLAVLFNGDDIGIEEASVRLETEGSVPFPDLLMEFRIDVHGVFLDKGLASCVVTFGFDALDFSEKVGEQTSKGYIVVNDKVCLSVTDLLFNDIVRFAFLIAPFRDELAVLHMGFGIGTAQLDSSELDEKSVPYIIVICRLVSLRIGDDSEFHHLWIGDVVEAEKIGSGLLESGLVFSQSGRSHSGKELTGSMTETFVEIGMHLIVIISLLR